MKVFKPLQLSLQLKNFSWQKKNQLAVTVLVGFPFDRSKETLLEQDLWTQLPDLLGEYPYLDAGMPKPQGEVLVYGSYYAPGGQAVTADTVQLSIGPLNKTLAVIGSRYWRALLTPTAPAPFTQMPVNYAHAFGGSEFNKNTLGKGIEEVEIDGEMRRPLPNIELQNHLITADSERPDAAGFAPLDMMWEPRHSKMGSYDEHWQQHDFPGYPQDLDWTHFNVAPADQWIDGFWHGDEAFTLLNMHPAKIELKGRLPAFRTRCFVQKKQQQKTLFSEVEMHAETAFLFPEHETGVMLFRGTLEVAEDDATDIDYLLLAYEDLAQQARPKDYYAETLANRLDTRKTFKYMMYTADIIPDSERCGFARMLDDVDIGGDSALARNLDARAEAEKQKALEVIEMQKQKLIDTLQSQNIDPAPYIEKFEFKQNQAIDDPMLQAVLDTMEQILPGVTTQDPSTLKVEAVDFSKFDDFERQMEALAASKLEQVKQKLAEVIKKVEGTDIEQQTRQQVEAAIRQMDQPPPLPRPSADATIESIQQQISLLEQARDRVRQDDLSPEQLAKLDINLDLDIPALKQKLDAGMAQIKQMYRDAAHYIKGSPVHAEPLDIIRYRFIKALEKGESPAAGDWAGVDFSGLDLGGIDFSDCYLEYANFSSCKLCGANLQRAIVTHANLSHADLSGANLQDCNLGDSTLHGAILSGSSLSGSILSRSDLSGATLSHCDLREVNFLEAVMTGVSMSDCQLQSANFLSMDFSGSSFIECALRQCNFLKCQLQNCNFSNSDLSASNFVECDLDHSIFRVANMTNVRFPAGSSLRQCDFSHARLDSASLRDADAEASNFEESSFYMADFSGANLQKTKFYGATGKRSLFIRADLAYADFTSVNLMEGSLMKARLTGADLSDSNLYSVEFIGATVGETDFSGANLDLTALENWRPGR